MKKVVVNRVVLDASALLAWLQDEVGHQIVDDHLDVACISTVNLSETVAKSIEHGGTLEEIHTKLHPLSITVIDFTEEDCIIAASLREPTRHLGLSLGDRACLALGYRLQATVLTSEKEWAKYDGNVQVKLIR